MDFEFSQEQKKFRQEVRDFLEEELRQGTFKPSCDAWIQAFSPEFTKKVVKKGWIGKSCLLITPDFGPRIRLVTVLTDAPLPSGIPLNEKCSKCRACVDACPVQAFKGVEFQTTEPVEARFNTRACADYRHTHPCGLCVAKCPVGHHT